MRRYSVAPLPGRANTYVIYDDVIKAYCSLPDDPHDPHPNLLPLEWPNRLAAEAWLYRCYSAWQSGAVPAPEDWRPTPQPGPGLWGWPQGRRKETAR
jgi:hypothetical protein